MPGAKPKLPKRLQRPLLSSIAEPQVVIWLFTCESEFKEC